MFDIGFSELLLIGIVALVVIGPERLPKVARTAGHLFGRMQRYVADVKADINREMQLDELKKMQEEMHASVHSIEQSVAKDLSQGAQEVKAVAEQIHEIVEIPQASAGSLPASADAQGEVAEQQLELDLPLPAASQGKSDADVNAAKNA